jgi:adenine-specific DNA-methyltransferase
MSLNLNPEKALIFRIVHVANVPWMLVHGIDSTQHLTREQLTQLKDEVGSGRSLLICCAAFRRKPEHYPNPEIKKIPKAVLATCEWGHDDCSLRIENLPKAPSPKGQQQLF